MNEAMSTRVHGGGGDAPARKSALADVEIRRFLTDFVKKRVPASDVDDVVQIVLCDALAAASPPEEREELRKWLIGIARHKVADFHRRTSREVIVETAEPEVPAAPIDGPAGGSPDLSPYESIEARSMVRWAEEQAASTREAKQTLDWMAREGEGEKLETIAAEAHLPAARVRQRVSRLRRWMKERWLAELAAVAALALLALLLWRALRDPKDRPEARPDPTPPPPVEGPQIEPSPLERARALRADALEKCAREAWKPCLDGLDEARALDAVGDAAPEVQDARARADRALRQDQEQPKEKEPTKSKLDAPPVTPTVIPRATPTAVPPKAPAPVPTSEKPIEKSPPRATTPSKKDESSPPLLGKPQPSPKGGKSKFESDFSK
jgi:RNA polymerase sigma factor (sigma-70 family)